MLTGKCPKCGTEYFGWALLDTKHTNCSCCGAQLEITRDGQIAGESQKPLRQSNIATNNFKSVKHDRNDESGDLANKPASADLT